MLPYKFNYGVIIYFIPFLQLSKLSPRVQEVSEPISNVLNWSQLYMRKRKVSEPFIHSDVEYISIISGSQSFVLYIYIYRMSVVMSAFVMWKEQ